MQLTFFDIIAVSLVTWLTYRGYKQGFIDDMIGVIGLIFLMFIAVQNMSRLANFLYSYFPYNRIFLTLCSFLLIIGVGWILISSIVRKLQVNINPTDEWEKADKVFGGAIGFIQGMVGISLIAMFFLLMPSGGRQNALRENSLLMKPSLKFGRVFFDAFSVLFPDAKSFTQHLWQGFGPEAIQNENAKELIRALDSEDTRPYFKERPYDSEVYQPPRRSE